MARVPNVDGLATTISLCLRIAKAFKIETEQMIERCISYGADPSDSSPIIVENPRSYPKNEVWRHTQTVIHFNAGQAFEGFLKLLLMIETGKGKETHKLLDLHSALSNDLQRELETEWNKAPGDLPMQLIAYVHSNTKPDVPSTGSYASNFRDFLRFLDDVIEWYTKRYSWEQPSQWSYFVVDLRPFLSYLDRVEKKAISLAKSKGYFRS